MKRNHFHNRASVPILLLIIAASCWGVVVLANKERAVGAQASLPAVSAQREPIDARAAKALRAGMPALQQLVFEANEGQVDPSVRFLARSGRQQLLLTSHSVLLRSLHGSLDLEFAGASDSSRVAGIDPLPGHRNYLIGNDPKKWQTGVPTFQRVLYNDLYPGIDLTFYGNQSEFEYDFIVRPGADPQMIRWQIDRATRARISPDGDLILKRRQLEVTQRKPKVYQDIDGERRVVDGHYSWSRRREISFEIGRNLKW